jgi:putative membrane protein
MMSGETYLWLKAVHVIAVISWMAGLLYLPRLFVYHATVKPGSETSELFKVMERRLLFAIMTPAMGVAWTLGLTMAVGGGLFQDGWFLAKLALVTAMTAAHVAMMGWRRDFAQDHNRRPSRFYRIANEAPTLLMIGIVILVILKPW